MILPHKVAALDLVVSIDNTTVHTAGAVGVPVWNLIPYVPHWRWFLNRDDSPWYPSMRLFRQPKINDWESVFDQVAIALEKRLLNYFRTPEKLQKNN